MKFTFTIFVKGFWRGCGAGCGCVVGKGGSIALGVIGGAVRAGGVMRGWSGPGRKSPFTRLALRSPQFKLRFTFRGTFRTFNQNPKLFSPLLTDQIFTMDSEIQKPEEQNDVKTEKVDEVMEVIEHNSNSDAA